jgi:Spy/CpxP family protein refolding chaperone
MDHVEAAQGTYRGAARKVYTLLLALLLVGFTTAVYGAASPESDHNDFHKHRGSRLNLTQEQMEKMKEMKHHFWADTHDLRYNIKMKKVEVQKLFTDPSADSAVLLAKEKELNGLKLQLMDKKAEMKVEWRKILNPEQIRMLDRIHGHHHGHHHHWRHHHGHWGAMGKKPQSKPAATMGQ